MKFIEFELILQVVHIGLWLLNFFKGVLLFFYVQLVTQFFVLNIALLNLILININWLGTMSIFRRAFVLANSSWGFCLRQPNKAFICWKFLLNLQMVVKLLFKDILVGNCAFNVRYFAVNSKILFKNLIAFINPCFQSQNWKIIFLINKNSCLT